MTTFKYLLKINENNLGVMKMAEEIKQYNINRGKTLIDIPHEGKTITFIYKQHGPDTYAEVARSIDKEGLARPTMAETASLVHQAFLARDEPEFSKIIDIMKNEWLMAFTGLLYIPWAGHSEFNGGIFVQDNPEIKFGLPFMDKSELVKKLEANDPSVRFIPFGFKKGKMSRELAKSPYIIALAGEEEAEKLAEIADEYDEYKSKPCLWPWGISGITDHLSTRVATLGFYQSSSGRGLGVRDYTGSSKFPAFGIQRLAKASQT